MRGQAPRATGKIGAMRPLLLSLAVLCACRPPPAGTKPGEEVAAEGERKQDPELTAVAATIDPGLQAPLFEAMPAWLKGKVDAQLAGDPASPEAVLEAREAIASWDKLKAGDTQAMLVGALTVARGVVLAERAVAAGSDDPELLAALSKAYRLVEQLGFFQDNQLFSQVTALGIEFAKKEGGLVGQQIEEGLALLKTAIARAPALHLHTAARLLREHPRHPTVPEVLVRLAQAEQSGQRFDAAKRLRRLAVERKGARATGADWAGLAETCYRALDRGCGDMAKKTAAERGPEGPDKAEAFQRRLVELEATAGRVATIEALAAATGLEQRLERGHQLLQLGRTADATALFDELRARHPGDARPVTGLAIVAAHKADFARSAALVRSARTLAGRDREFFEVALGTVPMVILTEVAGEMAKAPDKEMPALGGAMAEIGGLIEEFRAFDPPRAAVLAVALETAKAALPKFTAKDRAGALAVVRALPGRATALVKRFPGSRDVWRLVYTTSRLTGTAAEALAMATLPLPPELEMDPELRLSQARTLLDLAVQWEHVELMNAAGRAAEKLPEGTDVDGTKWLRATLDAQVGRVGDKVSLQRAVEAFQDLAARKTGKEKALAYNNLGYLYATAGEVEPAIKMFQEALQVEGEAPTPRLNIAAVAFLVEQREGLNEVFAAGTQAKLATVRQQSHAWLVALADVGMGDAAVTRQEFKAALAKEREDEFRGQMPLGRWGIAPQGEIKLSLGYSSGSGLVVIDEVVSQWWLFAPAPTMDALLADEKPAGKTTGKKQGKAGKKGAAVSPA